jgi:serine/threonine-protein kinase
VGRNRLAVGAAAAVAMAVLLGAGLAAWQARVALAEKQRAEEVKEFIASIFREADPYVVKGKLSAADLLKQAKGRLDGGRVTSPETRAELLGLIGSSLIGLEDYATAEAVLGEAAAAARHTLGPSHPWTLHLRARLADTHRYLGKTEVMHKELDELLPELRRNPRAFPDDLASAIGSAAHLAIDEGHYEQAQAWAQEALERIVAKHGEANPAAVAASMRVAVSYQYAGAPERALQATERAHRMSLAVYRGDHAHPRAIDARGIYGRALANAGRFDEGIEELQQAVSDGSALFGAESSMVGFYSADLARYRLETGDLKRAMEDAQRAHDIITRMAQPGSFTHAAAVHLQGVCLLAARRPEEALRYLAQAAEGLERARGADHERTLHARTLRALALAQLGRAGEPTSVLEAALRDRKAPGESSPPPTWHVLGVIERLAGRPAEALRLQQAALESIRPGPKAERERMLALTEQGLDEIELGQTDRAAQSLERALDMFERLQTHTAPNRVDALVGLGRVRMTQGRPADARPLLESADAFWRDFDASNRWAGEAAFWLGRCYAGLGRNADAARPSARARAILSRSPLPNDAKLLRLPAAR